MSKGGREKEKESVCVYVCVCMCGFENFHHRDFFYWMVQYFDAKESSFPLFPLFGVDV